MANKIYPSADAALKGVVADGQTLAVGGFGLCGIPEALIDALRDSRRQEPDRASPTTPASTASAWASCSRRARSRR